MSGATEITFLLRRAARQIAAAMDLNIHVDVPNDRPLAGSVEDARAG